MFENSLKKQGKGPKIGTSCSEKKNAISKVALARCGGALLYSQHWQADLEFKAHLVYRGSSGAARAPKRNPISRNNDLKYLKS